MIVKQTKRFCNVILLTLILSLGLIISQPAKAAHLTAPVHYISMEFDLTANSLRANSRIDLPAGVSLHLNLSRLNVSQIIVNGQLQEISTEKGDLDIPSSTKDQKISTTYSKKIHPDSTPYSTITEAGIALADGWHPVADREMLFKLTAHIPVNFEAISEADEIITFQISDKKQVTFRFPHPLYSINFVAGPYEVTQESFGEGKTYRRDWRRAARRRDRDHCRVPESRLRYLHGRA